MRSFLSIRAVLLASGAALSAQRASHFSTFGQDCVGYGEHPHRGAT